MNKSELKIGIRSWFGVDSVVHETTRGTVIVVHEGEIEKRGAQEFVRSFVPAGTLVRFSPVSNRASGFDQRWDRRDTVATVAAGGIVVGWALAHLLQWLVP